MASYPVGAVWLLPEAAFRRLWWTYHWRQAQQRKRERDWRPKPLVATPDALAARRYRRRLT
jgi:hypothetical protein